MYEYHAPHSTPHGVITQHNTPLNILASRKIAFDTVHDIPLALAAETVAHAALVAVSAPNLPAPSTADATAAAADATAAAAAASAAAYTALIAHAPTQKITLGEHVSTFLWKPLTILKIILVLIFLVGGYFYKYYTDQAYKGETKDKREQGHKNLAYLSNLTKMISTTAAIGGLILVLVR